jgi:hypothetical protein
VILYVIEIKSLRSLMHRWPTEQPKDKKALTLLGMFSCPDSLTLRGIIVEGPSVADGRDECGGRYWSDARDGHQPSAGVVLMT